MNSKLLPLAAVFAAVLTNRSHAAAPPAKPEPLRGAIVSGRVLTCVRSFSKDNPWLVTWFQPLRGGKPSNVEFVAPAAYLPVRWQASHGALWVTGSGGAPGLGAEYENRYDLAELFKGRMIIGPGATPEAASWNYFADSDAVDDVIFMRQRADFVTVLHSDYLAAGSDWAKVFVLTNVGGRGSAGAGSGQAVVRRYPQKATKRWSFTCRSITKSWDAKAEKWTNHRETEECSIDVVFDEPFQALACGEDYYFLTASGVLYRAPKPAKGKHRKLKTVWDDKRSPVTAFVTDVDRGRTFLFCDSGPKGKGGPCVFELASGVRLRFFDQKLYKPGTEGPTPLCRVVGYARVLEALGYVKEAARTSSR